MNVTAIHGYLLGFLVIGSWAIIMFWAFALSFSRSEDTPTFWRAVSFAQILLVLQLLLGLGLLAVGRLPGPPEDPSTAMSVLFHLGYGVVFPLIVLFVGHKMAREGRLGGPHRVFAVVGLVVFGLTARAWMVGISGF